MKYRIKEYDPINCDMLEDGQPSCEGDQENNDRDQTKPKPMTREQWKKRLPLIKAFTEGATIQALASDGVWYTLEAGASFNCDHETYRIKPEPRLRPWKPEEVPFGAWCRSKHAHEAGHEDFTSIIGVSKDCFYTVEDSVRDMCLSLKNSLNYVYSTDHGKTWLPCGVAE